MATKIIKFSSHSNRRSLHSLCHPRRVLANTKSILPLEQSKRYLQSRRPFFSWFTTRSNNDSSSVAAPPHCPSSPCLMLSPVVNKATREKVFRFYSLADKKVLKVKQHNNSLLPNHVRCIWSCHNWLAFVDTRTGAMYLWNPFASPSQEDVIQLPSILTLPSLAVVHGSDNRSIKTLIVKHYSIKGASNPFGPQYLLDNLVLSSAPSPSSDNNNCIVMALKGDDLGLVYCKLGDKKWTVLDAPSRPYTQICYSKKTQQFYAWSFNGYIEAWDLRDLTSIKRTSIFKALDVRRYQTYMVESISGDLLLAHWDSNPNHVYKLDNSGKWKNIKCLGEQALFLCQNQPFSLRAADFPGLKPNSIYFIRNEVYLGRYNMRSNMVEQFSPFVHLTGIYWPSIWIAPPQVDEIKTTVAEVEADSAVEEQNNRRVYT